MRKCGNNSHIDKPTATIYTLIRTITPSCYLTVTGWQSPLTILLCMPL